jgi:diadenosine tetraphosphate (Ap4A) HIT family hydrolase
MSQDANCPFCQKFATPVGWPAERIIWQFPHSIAVLGQWQYYTGYCLLISREHATELSHLEEHLAPFLEEMTILAGAIEACFAPHKLNYELLGNQVPHLHWHLFPRSADDPDRLRPVWFALEKAESDPAEKLRLETGDLEAAAIVELLRHELQSLHAPTA